MDKVNGFDIKWVDGVECEVGSEVSCLYCEGKVRVGGSRDILCRYGGESFGLCKGCEGKFQRDLMKRFIRGGELRH